MKWRLITVNIYYSGDGNNARKVVSAVRKDEQQRLKEEGDEAGYRALKRSRFILTSSRSRLEQMDKQAAE